MLRAMGNETRLRILEVLFAKERCVSGICEALEVEQPFASRHLAILRNAGLVKARRDAQRVIYSLHPSVQSDMAKSNKAIDLGCCEVRFPENEHD